jgi:hypothetical protein
MDDLTPVASRHRSKIESRWTLSAMFWLPESVFVSELGRIGATHLRHETFAVEHGQADLGALGDTLMARRHARGTTATVKIDGAVALIDLSVGSAKVEVAAADPAHADRVIDQLSELLGATVDDPGLVPVTFWAATPNGARSTSRRIAAPAWEGIELNYERLTAQMIGELLGAELPGAGRLVLWHGAPGTGKTHVLRALARQWAGWCSTHVITDPEAFLGAGTSYLLDVLTSRETRHHDQDDCWKLVVLEDAGELLAEDAHTRTGQALSRLLNITDGVLGQGMNTIILVSTNEPLGRLHPAIRRAGRCWRQIEFGLLDTAQANTWLKRHGADARVHSPATLADLYAIDRGDPAQDPTPFGFAAAAAVKEKSHAR